MASGIRINPAEREWSDEETEKLVKLWNDKKSAGEISVELKCSRNRVLGKVTRLRKYGLITRETTSQNPTGPRRKGRKVKTTTRHRKTQEVIPEAPMRLVAASTPKPPRCLIPTPETIEVRNLGLMDMLRSHCRWPTVHDGEQRFCANPTDGKKSYCQHHAAKMYARAG